MIFARSVRLFAHSSLSRRSKSAMRSRASSNSVSLLVSLLAGFVAVTEPLRSARQRRERSVAVIARSPIAGLPTLFWPECYNVALLQQRYSRRTDSGNHSAPNISPLNPVLRRWPLEPAGALRGRSATVVPLDLERRISGARCGALRGCGPWGARRALDYACRSKLDSAARHPHSVHGSITGAAISEVSTELI